MRDQQYPMTPIFFQRALQLLTNGHSCQPFGIFAGAASHRIISIEIAEKAADDFISDRRKINGQIIVQKYFVQLLIYNFIYFSL